MSGGAQGPNSEEVVNLIRKSFANLWHVSSGKRKCTIGLISSQYELEMLWDVLLGAKKGCIEYCVTALVLD